MTLEGMLLYFPSKYAKGRQCDRDYMFNVANTLYGDEVKELVEHALKQRHATDSITLQNESILLNDHWQSELKSLPFTSSVSHFLHPNCLFRKKDEWLHC